MGAAFLITLREGVEISLIVAILLAYLRQTGRTEMFRPVALGVIASIGICLAAGIAFRAFAGEFEGASEAVIEGGLALTAAAMLTWMIFWMRKHARSLKSELQSKLGSAVEKSAFAVALFAFVAVLREGFETALLLLGAELDGAAGHGAAFVGGGVAGLVVASYIGYLFYRGSRRMDLSAFFRVTAVLLVLFAAGMIGKVAHEAVELWGVTGPLADPVWNLSNPVWSESWGAELMAGMFGWSAKPELLRVVAYLAYAVPVTWLYFSDVRVFARPRSIPAGNN